MGHREEVVGHPEEVVGHHRKEVVGHREEVVVGHREEVVGHQEEHFQLLRRRTQQRGVPLDPLSPILQQRYMRSSYSLPRKLRVGLAGAD